MQNIVVVLYHASGVSNWISKLNPYLNDAKLHVLHFSSLQGMEMPEVEGVDFYDVSYFSYFKLKRTLKRIAPEKCLFLTFRSVLDLTLYKMCGELKIKRIYLEHGLMSPDTLRFRPNLAKKSPFSSAMRQLFHIYKYMGYAFSRWSFIRELRDFISVYLKSRFNVMSFDHYLLYSQRSFDCYKDVFESVEGNYSIVGYPVLNDEIQKSEAECFHNSAEKKGIVYVHQPLIYDGVASISYEEEKKFICGIEKALFSKYGRMTLLLHPRGNLDEYRERFSDCENIDVVKSPNNYKIYADKKLVVGHYSTALLYGLYFEVPTILIDYPTLPKNDVFAKIFPSFVTAEDAANANISFNHESKEYMLGVENTYEHICRIIMQS